jgi:GT2 family glycosyltransferase
MSNLIPCTESVKAMDDCEIIVAWDRSQGNYWTPPQSFYRVLPVDSEFIYARNCNLGISAANNDSDIILLNDDALLCTPCGFRAMQSIADENPDFGIIGAVTNITGQPLQHPHGVGLREVPHFAFVCVFIPRRTLNIVGMLDERYRIDYGVEDRDYCQAVKHLGMKCGVFDHCFVDHRSLVSTYRGAPTASRSFVHNWNLFCKKWGFSG